MFTIDKAIRICHSKASDLRKYTILFIGDDVKSKNEQLADKYDQIAEWLEELKELKKEKENG